MPYCYEYPRPSFTVDILIYTESVSDSIEILLIRRGNDPFAGMWALPGGFLELDEELVDAAIRELMEETGLRVDDLLQFRTYGTIGRDPRGRTISTIFVAKIPKTEVTGGDDAAEAAWFPLHKLPLLAFDHQTIVDDWQNSLPVAPIHKRQG